MGLSYPRRRTTTFLRAPAGPPGQVNKRPQSQGTLVPPNVSIQNQTNQGGPFPSAYGDFKWAPPYGGLPYIEYEMVDGYQETYTRALYFLGYGELEVTEIWLGSTKLNPVGLTNSTIGYDHAMDTYVEVRYGVAGETPLTLFPSVVLEDNNEVDLTQAWVYKETPQAADEATLLFNWSNGLYSQDGNDNISGATVDLVVQYAQSDGAGNVVGDWMSAGEMEVTAATTAAMGRSKRIVFPSRQLWIIRVQRTTPVSSGSSVVDDVSWVALNALTNENPMPPIRDVNRNVIPMAALVLRARTTDRNRQTLDDVMVRTQRKLNVYTGTDWEVQATSSPAWAVVDQFCGPMNLSAVDYSQFDGAAFKALADSCTALGFTYNDVLDEKQTAFQNASDIATSGRSSFIQQNGIYTIWHDQPQTEVVQMFTDRNVLGLSVQPADVLPPDYLEVQWLNPDIYYQQDELYVYSDGFNADGSDGKTVGSRYETYQLKGVTDPAQAYKLGRYYLANAALRPRTVTFQTDFEHLRCNMGDLIEINHPVLMIGSGAAIIKSVQTNGSGDITSITLDSGLGMDAGKNYSARIRLSDGTFLTEPVTNQAGLQTTLEFAAPISHTLPTLPQAGDLIAFGEQPTNQFIVTKIEPSSSPRMSARITAVDYSPNIFDSDTDEIGEFVSTIELPFSELLISVTPPTISNIQSGENVMTRASDGSYQPRILISASCTDPRVTAFEARFRITGSGANWTPVAPVSSKSGQISIQPVQTGVTYDLGIRAVTAAGDASDFVSQPGYTVEGTSTPPPDVTSADLSNGTLIWNPVSAVDLAGYQIKWIPGTDANWDAGNFVVGGIWPSTQLDVSKIQHGTVTYMIRAVDTAGNLSVNTCIVTTDIAEPIPANVVIETDLKALGWPGTISGATVDGSGNLAGTSTSSFWTGDADRQWTNDSDPEWTGSYEPLVYTFDITIPSYQLPGILYVLGNWPGGILEYAKDTTQVPMWTGDSNPEWTGDSNPFWNQNFGAFMPYPGQLTAEAATYRFRITIPGGTSQPLIDSLSVVLDVPDVEEDFTEMAVAAGGTRCPITKTFRVITAISPNRKADSGTGVQAGFVDRSTTIGAGPLIKVFDALGDSVAGTVDVVLKGY